MHKPAQVPLSQDGVHGEIAWGFLMHKISRVFNREPPPLPGLHGNFISW